MLSEHLSVKTYPSWLTDRVIHDFGKHAMAAYPNEACAFIVDGTLRYVMNISDNPTESFQLSAKDSAWMDEAQGFVHSHPNVSILHPSKEDMVAQINANKPFGIVACTKDSCSAPIFWGDHLLSVDLIGRPFVHGVFDCYSLLRAERFQRDGTVLPEFPRYYEWWDAPIESNPDMYETHFAQVGYTEAGNHLPLEIGDVFFMKINTKVVSHAAVYVGDGLILHHLRGRLSRIDNVAQWRKFIHKRIRFTA